MQKTDLMTWREEGKHLPEFLRDFHDQKDFFKMLHERVDLSDNDYLKDISWIEAQIYTIDVFLYVLAKYGYTLQKSRAHLEFQDIFEAIQAQNKIRNSNTQAVLLSVLKSSNPENKS